MKALTLHQPWASLIADGRKDHRNPFVATAVRTDRRTHRHPCWQADRHSPIRKVVYWVLRAPRRHRLHGDARRLHPRQERRSAGADVGVVGRSERVGSGSGRRIRRLLSWPVSLETGGGRSGQPCGAHQRPAGLVELGAVNVKGKLGAVGREPRALERARGKGMKIDDICRHIWQIFGRHGWGVIIGVTRCGKCGAVAKPEDFEGARFPIADE